MSFQNVGVTAYFDVSSFNRGQRDYTRGLQDAGRATQQFNTQINNINVSQFQTNISNTGSSLSNLGSIAGGAALAGVAALTAGIVAMAAALGESISTAASFESAFQGVAKTTDGLSELGADGFIELTAAGEQFKQGLKDLSSEIPATFEELAGIAELGGQLGVTFGQSGDEAQKTLLGFSETITMIADSTNLMAEDAATSLAKMTNLYKDSVDDIAGNIEQLGSTIVALGNSSATTEKDILNFANRLVGAGASVGLTQDEVLGMSAAFSSLGITAEAGGTAISDAMLKMFSAVNGGEPVMINNAKAIEANGEAMLELQEKMSSANADLVRFEEQTGVTGQEMWAAREAFLANGGAVEDWGRQLGDAGREKVYNAQRAIVDLQNEMAALTGETDNLIKTNGQLVQDDNLEKWAEASGLSVDEFKRLFEEDASAAILKFIEGLQQINAEGGDINAVLSDLGLKTSQQRQAFLKAANAGDIFEQSLDTAATAWEENTALADEAANRYATFESRLTILKNTFRNVGESIGAVFLPSLTRALQGVIDFVDGVGQYMPQILGVMGAIVRRMANTMGGLFAGFGADLDFGFLDRIGGAVEAFEAGGLGGLAFDLGFDAKTVGIANTIGNLLEKEDYTGVAKILENNLYTLISSAFKNLATRLSGLNVAFLGGIGPGILGEFLGIETTIGDVFAKIQGIVNTFTLDGAAGVGAQVGLLASLGLSDASIATVITGIDNLKAVLATIPAAFSAFSEGGFQGLAEYFGLPNFIPMIKSLGNIMAGFFAPTIENLKAGFIGFLMAFEPLLPALGEMYTAFQSALPVIGAFIGGGLLLAVGAVKLLGEAVAFLLPWVGTILASAFQIGITYLTSFFNWLTALGTVAMALYEGDIPALVQGLTDMVTALMTAFTAPFTTDLAQSFLNGVVGVVKPVFAELEIYADSFYTTATEYINQMVKGIEDTANELVTAVTTAMQEAWDAAMAFATEFAKTGAEIMTWIADGIFENIGTVQGALGSVIQDAIDAILGSLGWSGGTTPSSTKTANKTATGKTSSQSVFDNFTRSSLPSVNPALNNTTINNNYYLNVASTLPSANIAQDFELMRALA